MPAARVVIGLLSLTALAVLPLLPQSVSAQDAKLPKVSFTQAQVDRGRASYAANCVDCHGANLNDGEFGGPPLKGNDFKAKYFNTTADALYGFASSAMPPDRPGLLNPQTYADMVAYILSANGMQPGATELPPDLDKLAGMMVE